MCFDVVFEPIHSYGRELGGLTELNGDGDEESSGPLDRLFDRVLYRSPHIDPVVETKFCGRNQKIPLKKRKSDPVARENAGIIMTKTIEAERANWSRAIDRPWRATVEKTGARDHGVSSVELCQDFVHICAENMPERGEADLKRAPVSMAEYELEVLILLSHPGGSSRETRKPEMGRPPTAIFGATVSSMAEKGDGEGKAKGGGERGTEAKASAASTTAVDDARVLRTDGGNLDEDLWCFGIRVRRPSLLEKRGLGVMKTNFSVAASLCLLMLREQRNDTVGNAGVTVLDPMCGHGSLPLVMHLMQQKVGRMLSNRSDGRSENQQGNLVDGTISPVSVNKEGDRYQKQDLTMAGDEMRNDHPVVEPLPPFKLLGCDTKDSSYASDISMHFRDSLHQSRCQSQSQPTPSTKTAVPIQPPTASWLGSADTCRLQLRDSTIDCLIVDPPWGQRHGSHKFVEKNLRKWLFEWSRVLKVGGLLGMVTIRTNHMVRELAIEPFARNLVSVEGFPLRFNNCGYPHCMFFLLRRVG